MDTVTSRASTANRHRTAASEIESEKKNVAESFYYFRPKGEFFRSGNFRYTRNVIQCSPGGGGVRVAVPVFAKPPDVYKMRVFSAVSPKLFKTAPNRNSAKPISRTVRRRDATIHEHGEEKSARSVSPSLAHGEQT